MPLIFLNRYFHPDHSATSQMLSDLAFALAAEGRSVHVLTSRLRYDDPAAVLPASETIDGVTVTRLWTSRFGRSNLLGRAVDYATFYLSAGIALARLARPGDTVIAKTDPPMLAVLTTPIAHWRGAKAVSWMQDLFPEVAEASGMFSGLAAWLAWLLRRLRSRSLRKADRTVAIGAVMGQRLVALGAPRERIVVSPNWADGTIVTSIEHSMNSLRRGWGLSGQFVVAYSGNLGRVHDAGTILAAVLKVAESKPARPVIWLFIGGGAGTAPLQARIPAALAGAVRFLPYQPRARLAESLSAADVHLVSLRPEFEGLIVPSKFYGIAAAGRPALFIGDPEGEIATVLKSSGCGLTVAQGDGDALAKAVLDLSADPERCQAMGARARALFEREYDKLIAVATWRRLLASLEAETSGVS